MDTVLYILMFACLGLVVTWYVANEVDGACGENGLLSILAAELAGASGAGSYRPVSRLARPKGRAVPFREVDDPPRAAYRETAGPGRRYRMRDDAAYRDAGDAPRYGVTAPETPRAPRYRALT